MVLCLLLLRSCVGGNERCVPVRTTTTSWWPCGLVVLVVSGVGEGANPFPTPLVLAVQFASETAGSVAAAAEEFQLFQLPCPVPEASGEKSE